MSERRDKLTDEERKADRAEMERLKALILYRALWPAAPVLTDTEKTVIAEDVAWIVVGDRTARGSVSLPDDDAHERASKECLRANRAEDRVAELKRERNAASEAAVTNLNLGVQARREVERLRGAVQNVLGWDWVLTLDPTDWPPSRDAAVQHLRAALEPLAEEAD